MDFTSDAAVNDIKDQWMFGPALMACPVSVYKARSRQVYLPKQTGWYDLYTNQYYQGGQTITADAPYEKIPVFVPQGAIIPFGPEIEWSDEKQPDLITLYVYAGKNGEFTLYEDEGVNYNYEKGKYTTIAINYDDSKHTLTIGNRQGEFDGMLKQRKIKIVLRTPDQKVAGLNVEQAQGRVVTYNGKCITVKL